MGRGRWRTNNLQIYFLMNDYSLNFFFFFFLAKNFYICRFGMSDLLVLSVFIYSFLCRLD